jgi:hypothetical protein
MHFRVGCVCVSVFVSRCTPAEQTNTHSREIGEIVPALTRARAQITRTLLSCGGDECDTDSIPLLRQSYIYRHTSMHVCLFDFLSIPDSWLPDSDSLLLLVQSYIPTCVLVCLCIYISVLFFVCFAEYTLQLVS